MIKFYEYIKYIPIILIPINFLLFLFAQDYTYNLNYVTENKKNKTTSLIAFFLFFFATILSLTIFASILVCLFDL
jgi:hypothetical protein